MKKKFAAMLIACLCVAQAATAVAPIAAPITVEAATKTSTTKKKKAPTLNKVYKAVKNAYGDDYTPTLRLSKDEANERYGLKKSWYSGVIAELPMISVNADELVIVKAKDKKSKTKIKKALQAYKEKKAGNMHDYPGKLLQYQAARIYVKGDYVCFIILGSIDNKTAEQTEEKVIAAYKKQNEKAVDAIKKLY